MNGIEKLYYAKNTYGHVYLTTPYSPLKPGYIRYSTTVPSEMDKIFAKMDEQVRSENEGLNYKLYLRRKEQIEKWRSDIRSRMLSSECSDEERDILRVALTACDNRERKLMENNAYGVSEMQKKESNPKAPGENPVHFIPAATETIQ
ncbi:MAG: hypothetical protein KGL39_19250 [Patescibacteria group bacterium]|nr:hypothetical protein [Patescibacteria group bacterium]